MPDTYRVALIGCGRMGATIDDEVRDRQHSDLWIPYSHAAAVVACDRTELVSVSDTVAEKAEAIRERYQAGTCYTDYREMIDAESPDIVCIATRPATHAEMTVYASQHGVKGIYCEKPLCGSMAEADAMVEAVEKHHVKFNYGTQRRYVPLYSEVRRIVESGELGKIDCVIAQQGTSAALWGLTHGADLMLHLVGDPEVDFVQGTALCEEDDWEGHRLKADPGIAAGYVLFSNGIHGYFTAGRGVEFEVCGTEGKIRTFDNGLSWRLRKPSGDGQTMEDAAIPDIPLESGTVNGILDIAEALDTGRETRGPAHLARRSQEMLMGIILSHRLGGIRIPLPMAHRELYVGRDGW